MGFPSGASGKEPNCQSKNITKFGFDPKSPGGGMKSTPEFLQGDPMDRGAYHAIVTGHTEPNMTEVTACTHI